MKPAGLSPRPYTLPEAETPVSIFNDVIGCDAGPSSSHCAAVLRIGRLARDVMRGDVTEVVVEYDTQGSDMGLFAGLMGWDAADERLPDSGPILRETGVRVSIKAGDFHDPHPSTDHLTLSSSRERHVMTAVSRGGGMIEVIGLDGFSLSLAGDYWETLICLDGSRSEVLQTLARAVQADYILVYKGPEGLLVQIKANQVIEDAEILGHRSDGHNAPLWEQAVQYERERAGLSTVEADAGGEPWNVSLGLSRG